MIRVLHEDATVIAPEFSPLEAYGLTIRQMSKADMVASMGLPESAAVLTSLNGVPYYRVEGTIQSTNLNSWVTFQHGIIYQYLFYTMVPWDDAAFDAYYAGLMTILNGVQYTDPNPSLGRIYRMQLFFSYALAAFAVVLLHGLLPRWVALAIYRKTRKRREWAIVKVNATLWSIVLVILLMTMQLPSGVFWFALALSIVVLIANYFHIAHTRKKTADRPPLDVA
jgi:hypothetical protein